MTLYDSSFFDTITDRRNTNSYKWAIGENELPMWVADMDFQVATEIRQVLEAKASEGIYGYQTLPTEWHDAYRNWWKERHHLEFDRESLIFCTGVVPAISSAVRKLTTPGENVVIMTPVYNIFFNCIRNNGRNILENRLIYRNGRYAIDFEDLEKKLSNPQTTMLILCNPHNPIGKIWDRDTLATIGELCDKYHVIVLSDEIHCDLTDPGRNYVPFARVSEKCRNLSITALAPTKAFNIAGIQTAAVMVPNPVLRHKMWRALNTDEVAEPNVFAVPAAIAAFTKGAPWLDALRKYLYDTKNYIQDFVSSEIPDLRLLPCEATYLLWFDCAAYSQDSAQLCREIREKTGLFLNQGAAYGGDGNHFFRMNIACPRVMVRDGMRRLKAALKECNR